MNKLFCDDCQKIISSKEELTISGLRSIFKHELSFFIGDIRLLCNKCSNKKRMFIFRRYKLEDSSSIDIILFFLKFFLIFPCVIFFGALVGMLLINVSYLTLINKKIIVAFIILVFLSYLYLYSIKKLNKAKYFLDNLKK